MNTYKNVGGGSLFQTPKGKQAKHSAAKYVICEIQEPQQIAHLFEGEKDAKEIGCIMM
jgi:hypothetical protein